MQIYVLNVALIILMCLFLSKISNKLGLPTLLLFIFLGMIFGSDGIFKIDFDNYIISEYICSIALIFIMFYGGFGTNWKKSKTNCYKIYITFDIRSIFNFFNSWFVLLFCFKI